MGNADYVIGEPERYPFAMSEDAIGQWINAFLIKANPALHKRTFLKPHHRTAEFCGTCHKVHIPEAVNDYRWLRGQNHYDSFLLSGVSGHGVASFYYPDKAQPNCNGCHMPLVPSGDFAARRNDDGESLTVHSHAFASGNTALPHLLGLPDHVIEAHRAFLTDSLRVDIFGVRLGSAVDAALAAPLRPHVPALKPGGEYVVDIVLRTLTLGHHFTQGTSDSNEIWLEVTATAGDRVLGKSGGVDADGAVDPWSHFVNAYVLDRDGNRIDRRNAEDIFTRLYDHQIPPGAASVAHYGLRLPDDLTGTVTITTRLHYRKFDTTYLRHFQGAEFAGNDLPVIAIAADRVVFPVAPAAPTTAPARATPEWQRWNDYGIGLLAKPERGMLKQAEAAFERVAALGAPDGDLNAARALIREGRLDEATDALERARAAGARPWSVAWFAAEVALQNGEFDTAIEMLTGLVETRFPDARARGFDFSRDARLLNKLGNALFERSKLARPDEARQWLQAAADRHSLALQQDPENFSAHYALAQIHARLGNDALAAQHRAEHSRYRVDDNARDRAIVAARAGSAAANHAAEAVVIYDLQRPGAFELEPGGVLGTPGNP